VTPGTAAIAKLVTAMTPITAGTANSVTAMTRVTAVTAATRGVLETHHGCDGDVRPVCHSHDGGGVCVCVGHTVAVHGSMFTLGVCHRRHESADAYEDAEATSV
jgi:hypothetical protein